MCARTELTSCREIFRDLIQIAENICPDSFSVGGSGQQIQEIAKASFISALPWVRLPMSGERASGFTSDTTGTIMDGMQGCGRIP